MSEFIQRVRGNEIRNLVYYYICIKSEYFNRDEELDKDERFILQYVKNISNWYVTFLHSKKDLRRSCKQIAKNTLSSIEGAVHKNNYIAIRKYLKRGYLSLMKLVFGEDFINLVEEKSSLIYKLLYEQESFKIFSSKEIHYLTIESCYYQIYKLGTEKNLVREHEGFEIRV